MERLSLNHKRLMNMNLPFFFAEKTPEINEEMLLDEENAKHVAQALRMGVGEKLMLTDGKGNLVEAEITGARKKYCSVKALSAQFIPRQGNIAVVAISLIKNSSRFEWFLEKASELGIAAIIPLLCERTEKQHFRRDRFVHICVSAMLQSRQAWLPDIHMPTSYTKVLAEARQDQKFIAHCMEDQKRNLSDLFNSAMSSHIVLIGPEGDFTPGEAHAATDHHFDAISLGNTRLRTETAGIVAATILRIF